MKCLAAEIIPVSTLDYPDRACAVVFMAGCPLRCPYCSNWNIKPIINDTTAICDQLIKLRRGVDCVTVSGGEPLCQGKAFQVISRCAHRLNYKVGVQTSGVTGSAPHWVAAGLLETVMLDLKAAPHRYREVCGCEADVVLDSARRLAMLRADGRLERYDTRTTVFRGISDTEEEIVEIAKHARGSDTYTIVQGRPELARPGAGLEETPADTLSRLGAAARRTLDDRTRVYVKGHDGIDTTKKTREEK